MPQSTTSEPQSIQQDPDIVARVGGWLFTHRTSLPLPIAAALLLVPSPGGTASAGLPALGVAIVAAGELLRLWGVHHIGVISRTRSDRLGPLVDGGPFGLMRNPLYLGNILLWLGFAVSARLLWLAPIVAGLLAVEYHFIVRWEERLLESRLGERYREYMRRVPRWIPRLGTTAPAASCQAAAFSWSETLYSERGTLIAIVAGFALLALKAQVAPPALF